MKKLFFKIFPPDRFDSTSYFTMMCGLVVVLYSLISSCGPSKAELEAAVKKQLDETIGDTSGVIVSTDKSEVKISKVMQIMKPDGSGGGSIRFLTIDNHEYIQFYSDNGASMCHDENCSNEIHKK